MKPQYRSQVSENLISYHEEVSMSVFLMIQYILLAWLHQYWKVGLGPKRKSTATRLPYWDPFAIWLSWGDAAYQRYQNLPLQMPVNSSLPIYRLCVIPSIVLLPSVLPSIMIVVCDERQSYFLSVDRPKYWFLYPTMASFGRKRNLWPRTTITYWSPTSLSPTKCMHTVQGVSLYTLRYHTGTFLGSKIIDERV